MSAPLACANIGPRQRRQRLLLGGGLLLVSALLAALLAVREAPRWWFLLLFPLLWAAMLGLFQARARTCVFLAASGKQNLDAGEEPVDGQLDDQLRRQARRILARSLLAALALTGLTLLLLR